MASFASHELQSTLQNRPRVSKRVLSIFNLLLIPYTAASRKSSTPANLIRSSCTHATYPTLCISTLSTQPGPPARTLNDLAQTAVKVSLSRTMKVSGYLARLARSKSPRKRERVALKDCAEQVSDAASQLKDTLRELKRIKTGSFRWRMSNAKTWVSAALTCQSTCLDGIREVASGGGKMMVVVIRDDVRVKIRNLSKVTSNALYLINLLDQKGNP